MLSSGPAAAACPARWPIAAPATSPRLPSACWADATRAAEVLGWRTQRDIDAMCRDAWCWQQANPDGYGG